VTPQSIAYGLFSNLRAPLINKGELKANFKRAYATQIETYFGNQESHFFAFTEINNAIYLINSTERM
jgi:hypothetical protein